MEPVGAVAPGSSLGEREVTGTDHRLRAEVPPLTPLRKPLPARPGVCDSREESLTWYFYSTLWILRLFKN